MRHLAPQTIEVVSAGSHPTYIHPIAVETLAAMDVDIRQQKAKHINQFTSRDFDYVITVCDRAQEVCPQFSSGHQIHWGLSDPADVIDIQEKREAFRRVALQLKTRIKHLISTLDSR